MTDDPLDLRPLDPTADPAAFARRIDRLVEAAGPMLARRRRVTPVEMIVAWRVPILAAATALLAVGLALAKREEPAPLLGRLEVARAMGIPGAVVQWLDTPPSPADLLEILPGDLQ